jgi:nitrite reductase (NADH) small subunit
MTTTHVLEHPVFNLGPADRIPLGEGRRFNVEGGSLAVFRSRQGGIFFTDAGCPHKNGPLADGTIADGSIVCPLHACSFNLKSGNGAGHNCGTLKTYPARIDTDGSVIVGGQ